PDAIESYYVIFDSLLTQKKDVFETLLAMPDTFLLAEYPGRQVDKNWIVDYMAFFLDHQKMPRFKSPEDLQAFIEDNHILDLLVQEGSKLPIVNSVDFQKEIDRYILQTAHAYYYSVVIYEDISPTEEDLVRYYVRNKEKYLSPKKVLVQEILVSDSSLAFQLHKEIKNGADFATLTQIYTERPAGKRNRGLLDPFSQGQYGEMGKKAFEMNPGEISDPIPLGDNKYSIINVIEFYPETPLAYEQIKKKVAKDYLEEKRDELRENAFTTLYEKYDVHINPLYQK
ncbi:MAG: peptidylprolyl isomerase, partial [Candidatus Marinimicrobia bacterium]|nr:peptidylprolyl isomerase [Candidatus Neomarinimicrobiota bacterium]